jgi:two-component system, NtrC family, response regulator GlrR
MKTPKISIFDFNPTGETANDLKQMLTSTGKFDVQIQKMLCPQVLVGQSDVEFPLNPDAACALIFALLPPAFLKFAGQFFQQIKQQSEAPVIVVIEAESTDDVLRLLEAGAADFITLPLKTVEFLPRVWRLLARYESRLMLIDKLKQNLGLKQILGNSPMFVAQIKKLPVVAKCDVGVLITGETGTGKELIARAIHYLSPRASGPFIPVNCGAIPIELMENELFGHERGAYTGANSSHDGLIQEANGGTLFLDEVNSLHPLAQVKLLRFLQEKEYRPLGSRKTVKAEVRIVAAANTDLEADVKSGKLRQDLYYRLNVVPIKLPALRERLEDIALLANHFLAKYRAEFNKDVRAISDVAMHRLMSRTWPGNVRELEHVIQRATVMCEGEIICEEHITLSQEEKAIVKKSFQQHKAELIAEFEKNYISDLLLRHHGNITRAAQAAKKNRRAFWQLIHKHGINVNSFRASQ